MSDKGIQRSAHSGKAWRCGRTPTTWKESESSRICEPMTACDAPNLLRQSFSLMMATCCLRAIVFRVQNAA